MSIMIDFRKGGKALDKKWTIMVETRYNDFNQSYSPRYILKGFYTKDIQEAEAVGMRIEKLLNERGIIDRHG